MPTAPTPAIVIVDDSSLTRTLICHILQQAVPDYALVSVAHGAAALALLAQRPIALVRTDQHMPGMDGVALTIAIKAVAPQCPVILMTGLASIELRQRATAAGADDVVLKPFGGAQLAPMVRAALAPDHAARAAAPPRRRATDVPASASEPAD